MLMRTYLNVTFLLALSCLLHPKVHYRGQNILPLNTALSKPHLVHCLTVDVQGGSNMTGTYAACLHTNQSRSYLNHLVSNINFNDNLPVC